ncbi:hypothetical protein BDD12DRAFT_861774 [Trichophaea hybrida]|nr:hypothetical protein BDD12DRAFT_861774 [Trichophaea hybrida]
MAANQSIFSGGDVRAISPPSNATHRHHHIYRHLQTWLGGLRTRPPRAQYYV